MNAIDENCERCNGKKGQKCSYVNQPIQGVSTHFEPIKRECQIVGAENISSAQRTAASY
jgi:hypothetical protein